MESIYNKVGMFMQLNLISNSNLVLTLRKTNLMALEIYRKAKKLDSLYFEMQSNRSPFIAQISMQFSICVAI